MKTDKNHPCFLSPQVLSVRNVTKRFGGRPVLRDVSFAVKSGTSAGFLGINGAGKTTLFNILAGFEHADQGTITLGGQQIGGLSPSAVCRLGLVTTFQRPLSVPGFSVGEILRLALGLAHRPNPPPILHEIINHLVPSQLWDQSLAALDGAMLRRVDVARALATQPQVVLLDEVFATQDQTGKRILIDCLAEAKRLGVAFLVADHVPDVLATVCEELHLLTEGQLVESGAPAKIIETAIARRYYFGASTDSSSP